MLLFSVCLLVFSRNTWREKFDILNDDYTDDDDDENSNDDPSNFG